MKNYLYLSGRAHIIIWLFEAKVYEKSLCPKQVLIFEHFSVYLPRINIFK